jgi:hypothetical protein
MLLLQPFPPPLNDKVALDKNYISSSTKILKVKEMSSCYSCFLRFTTFTSFKSLCRSLSAINTLSYLPLTILGQNKPSNSLSAHITGQVLDHVLGIQELVRQSSWTRETGACRLVVSSCLPPKQHKCRVTLHSRAPTV